jgi:hypothetical protein
VPFRPFFKHTDWGIWDLDKASDTDRLDGLAAIEAAVAQASEHACRGDGAGQISLIEAMVALTASVLAADRSGGDFVALLDRYVERLRSTAMEEREAHRGVSSGSR